MLPADLTLMTNAIGFLLEVESAASFDDATRSGDINQLQNPNGSRSSWPNTFRQSRFVPAVEYIRAMRIRTLLHAAGGRLLLASSTSSSNRAPAARWA